MRNNSLKDLIVKVLAFLLIIGAVSAVVIFCTMKLKSVNLENYTQEVQQTSVKEEDVEKTQDASEEITFESIFAKSTDYEDDITNILFVGSFADYAVMISEDSTFLTTTLTSLDTSAPVEYKNSIVTTIAQASTLGKDTFNEVCLVAFDQNDIDYTFELSDSETQDLIALLQEEQGKEVTDTFLLSGSELGTLLVDEFVGLAKSETLTFNSLSKVWSALVKASDSDITFNQLSEIILSLSSNSVKKNWEDAETSAESEGTKVRRDAMGIPFTFEFTEEIVDASAEAFAASQQEAESVSEPVAEEEPVVSAKEAAKADKAAKKAAKAAEKAALVAERTETASKTTKYNVRSYSQIDLGYGFSWDWSKTKKLDAHNREAGIKYTLGLKVSKNFSVFASAKVIRTVPDSNKGYFSEKPSSYSLIPGLGFDLNFDHFGITSEANTEIMLTHDDETKVSAKLGATVTPYFQLPVNNDFSFRINAPVGIQVLNSEYKLSGSLTLGMQFINK